MSYFLVYFITILTPINIFLGILGLIFLLFGFMGTGIYYGNCKIDDPKLQKFWKKTFLVAFIIWSITIFIPTTKDAAAIYLIPKIVNSEIVNNADTITTKIIEKYLDIKLDKKEK